MRVRTAVAGAGIAALAVLGLGLPAQAADWVSYGQFPTKKKCVDAGQQYVRENFNAYKCTEIPGAWVLWLK